MVNPNVALACASAGAVLVTVAFFLGIAFMTSDQFATAGLQCNPEVLPSYEQETAEGFCVDNAVTDADGATCQIANLGLYSAAYTPECTQSDSTNPYALSSLLDPQEGSPADITVLFPTQTGLGSLPAGLNITTVPEFTTCAEFFAGDTGFGTDNFASQITTVAAAGGLALALPGFQASVKEGYDQGIADALATLETTFFQATVTTLVGTQLAALQSSIPTLTAAYSDNAGGLGGATKWTDLTALSPITGLSDFVTTIIEDGRTALPTEENIFVLAAEGYDRTDTGFPPDGLWGYMDSTTLCSDFVGTDPCSGIDYITQLAVAFGELAGSGDPSAIEAEASLLAALGLLDGYLAGVNAATMGTATNAQVTLGIAAADATTLATFSTTAVTAGVLGAYDPDAAFGSATGFPDDPSAAMASSNPVLALVCTGAGLADTCTTFDLLEATFNASIAANDTATASDVAAVQGLALTCASTGWTTCVTSSAAYRSFITHSVFGSLYGLEEETIAEGEAALVAAMIASCEDSEKDLAAITLLQTLAPVGTAFLGLGALILIANLFMRNDKVKILGVVGGVLCLIGTIIVIAGLLVLQGAPIYAALGEEPADPLPDNSTSFALGGAYIIVLVFLGGAAVGSIVSIIGGALLSPKESSTDILGKA